jgi:hypothetical protein
MIYIASAFWEMQPWSTGYFKEETIKCFTGRIAIDIEEWFYALNTPLLRKPYTIFTLLCTFCRSLWLASGGVNIILMLSYTSVFIVHLHFKCYIQHFVQIKHWISSTCCNSVPNRLQNTNLPLHRHTHKKKTTFVVYSLTNGICQSMYQSNT